MLHQRLVVVLSSLSIVLVALVALVLVSEYDRVYTVQTCSDHIHSTYIPCKNGQMTPRLQQFFMVPEFRQGILTAALPDAARISKIQYGENLSKLLEQMQTVFGFLSLSSKKAFNPSAFVGALQNKPWGFFPLDSPVHEQNDANEFFNLLVDRVELALAHTPNSELLKQCFGGQLVQQMLCKGCPHSSERLEPFFQVSLDIKKKSNIQESLDSFVKGEMLEGENAYFCELCNKKVDSLKRTCFHTVPQTLVLHLKRFEMNYDTWEKSKLNDTFAFPMIIDLSPYTKAGIDGHVNVNVENNVDGGPVDTRGCGSDHNSNNQNHDGSGDQQCTACNSVCRLQGVLVHSGTAHSGIEESSNG